jgi:1,4-alpha-glucan branching enzyme
MKPGDVELLAAGAHGDPFRVLGPHLVMDQRGAEHWEVRAMLPAATRAAVRAAGAETVMERVSEGGVHIARLAAKPAHYTLAVCWADGLEEELEDPYRFAPLISSFDLHLHGEGTQYESYETMGAHLGVAEGAAGVRFAVWAPSADAVSVVGDFNGWDTRRHPMRRRDHGIWEIFIPGLGHGAAYKYSIYSRERGPVPLKCDPYAFCAQTPPEQASIVWDTSGYEWGDATWMSRRAENSLLHCPMSVYEVHLESWMRLGDGKPLSYRQLAAKLVPYVRDLGFTHIELMPVMEHPYSGSWGYQVTGFFAPTSRFGTPQDFMYLVDTCHQAGIGVILDWVPGHFPKDAHGLARFDGTALYEHEDPRQGEQPDWGTLVFNYGRNEVRTFLISNALFWLKRYHIDGLRVDAVASMLYLDFSREGAEWVPNRHGGRENLEAIEFLKQFNEQAHTVPGAVTLAEESTDFSGVSRPVYANGLGFTMKWNMGWMHDMFRYFKQDPVHRKFHHNSITFSLLYAFKENYLLPISHDEVVHGKSSLIGKMPGDEWRRFANVRAFLAYMYGHPGKKLLFMGCEIGQYEEWNYKGSIRWELLQYGFHRKLQALVAALNRLYTGEPALYEVDYHWDGFEWIDLHDVEQSVICFVRRARNRDDFLVFVCNFTPVVRRHYRVGAPAPGAYAEILNTDAGEFGGSGIGNPGVLTAQPVWQHERPQSLELTLPPLGVIVLRPLGEAAPHG